MKTFKTKQRTLLLNMADGKDMKITLPEGARITFGPTIPGKRNQPNPAYGSDASGYSLRIYEDAKNDSLIAVFCDVRSFRDITLPCSKLVLREAGQTLWKSDEDGYKVEREVKVQKTFQDLKLLETSKT